MKRFWELVTAPVLALTPLRRVVEIGSQAGESTRLLLELCAERGAHADIVDPLPPANLEDIAPLLEAHGAFHQMTSLEALDVLPVADVYLIDGDHNWYTVFHELTAIEARVDAESNRRPLMVFHDVDWPYGRRDLYYDPTAVPEQHRHEFVEGGVTPGQREATSHRGLNQHLQHARFDGGAKNGVRTAIEDFTNEHPHYDWHGLHGFNGLGFLVPKAAKETAHAERIRAICESDSAIQELLNRVELDRMKKTADLEQTSRALRAMRIERNEAELRAKKAAAERDELGRQLDEVRSTRGFQALEQIRNVRRRLRKFRS